MSAGQAHVAKKKHEQKLWGLLYVRLDKLLLHVFVSAVACRLLRGLLSARWKCLVAMSTLAGLKPYSISVAD